MYSIEESLKEFWASCFGIDMDAKATAAELLADPLEVAKSALLKNDHGTCGTWPADAADNCADGFERKAPKCGGCDNDFVMRNNPRDHPDCDCDNLTQLQPLFRPINSGDKITVMNAINMTSVFIYQSSVAVIGNTDTGSHNYYMIKQPRQPWRVINADPDWSWGHCLGGGGRGGEEKISSMGAPCHADKCMALPWRGGGTEVEPNRWCCGHGPACGEGFELVDGAGTPGAQECFQGLTSICCIDPAWNGIPPPPPSPDEIIVQSYQGSCGYAADGLNSLHGAQNNQFLRAGGPVQTHFEAEYVRFLYKMLTMPEWQPCALADAAAVLLGPDGVIRAAYEEDRAFWTRPQGDPDEHVAFFGAWARLRLAAVKAVVHDAIDAAEAVTAAAAAAAAAVTAPPAVAGGEERGQLIACGMAQPGEVGDLCAPLGLIDGRCDQGTLLPRCVNASEAGYDSCGCPPGYGWSTPAVTCKPQSKTSAEEAAACSGGGNAAAATAPPVSSGSASGSGSSQPGGSGGGGGGGGDSNSSSGWLMGVAALLVIGLGVGLTATHFQNVRSQQQKSDAAAGIYGDSTSPGLDGLGVIEQVGEGGGGGGDRATTSDIVLETVDNPTQL